MVDLISFHTLLPEAKIDDGDFEFKKPRVSELNNIFRECHNLIWKAETGSPSFAFYEFVKLMFVKLDEDKKLMKNGILKEIINSDLPIPREEVIFSSAWIERQEKQDKNPVNNILFNNLRNKLDVLVFEGKKKRIFDKNEQIQLKATTINSIVRLLEHYNLFGIDEDLNGRMFETFLTATMRGKALGQFFTPRSVVKFMTNLANLEASKGHVDSVIDACCGTGGFLIESMATMREKILNSKNLSDLEKEELLSELVSENLFGIDAGKEPPIARIARINMYLHGDGGSRIYFADSLDKKMTIDDATEPELKRDLDELIKELTVLGDGGNKFDVALTNPPFAVRYKKDDEKDVEILEQYEISYKEGTTKLYTTSRSNILFLERYKDLLKVGGKLVTIIDDTPLNGAGEAAKAYRRFIRKYFIIKAVISLPKNTFVNADTNPKVSVLYLTKKRSSTESQPAIFMAISKSVGHDTTGKSSNDSDLDLIEKYYKEFEERGTIAPLVSDTQIFLVNPDELQDEINPFIYCTELKNIKDTLKQLEQKGKIQLILGKKMPLVKNIHKDEAKRIKYDTFKYFALRDVSSDGTILSHKELEFENLPKRAQKRVKTFDVIMSRNAGSLGKIAVIPERLDGQFCSDGFLVFRMETRESAFLLASILRTDLVQKQMYYAQREAIQPDIKEKTFKERLVLPFPEEQSVIDRLVSGVDRAEAYREKIKEIQEEGWRRFNQYTGWEPVTKLQEESDNEEAD